MAETTAVGQCVLKTWTEGFDHHFRVVRADPKIRVCADMLQEVSVATERGESRWTFLVGDVLTIRADNRTVVYRIDYTDYDASDDSYGAEWPD